MTPRAAAARRARRSSPAAPSLYPRAGVRPTGLGHGDRTRRSASAATPASPPARPRTTCRWSAARRSRSGRDMHWLRVDRYITAKPTTRAPTSSRCPCMHCEEAPCEIGLPGQRHGAHARRPQPHGLQPLHRHAHLLELLPLQGAPLQLVRLPAAEPAASARRSAIPRSRCAQRGVMEKCTYCVQRISERAHRRRARGRPIRDGEVVTACQHACPTQAIVFGDLADPTSRRSAARGRAARLHAAERARHPAAHDLSRRGRAPPSRGGPAMAAADLARRRSCRRDQLPRSPTRWPGPAAFPARAWRIALGCSGLLLVVSSSGRWLFWSASACGATTSRSTGASRSPTTSGGSASATPAR